MHELSLAEDVMQIIEDKSREAGFSRVACVWLEVGRLANVEVDAFRLALGAVFRGTLAESARIELIDIPGEAWCPHCVLSVAVNERYDACPHCGAFNLRVTDGTQLRLRELEVS